jgi:hypothetical protein
MSWLDSVETELVDERFALSADEQANGRRFIYLALFFCCVVVAVQLMPFVHRALKAFAVKYDVRNNPEIMESRETMRAAMKAEAEAIAAETRVKRLERADEVKAHELRALVDADALITQLALLEAQLQARVKASTKVTTSTAAAFLLDTFAWLSDADDDVDDNNDENDEEATRDAATEAIVSTSVDKMQASLLAGRVARALKAAVAALAAQSEHYLRLTPKHNSAFVRRCETELSFTGRGDSDAGTVQRALIGGLRFEYDAAATADDDCGNGGGGGGAGANVTGVWRLLWSPALGRMCAPFVHKTRAAAVKAAATAVLIGDGSGSGSGSSDGGVGGGEDESTRSKADAALQALRKGCVSAAQYASSVRAITRALARIAVGGTSGKKYQRINATKLAKILKFDAKDGGATVAKPFLAIAGFRAEEEDANSGVASSASSSPSVSSSSSLYVCFDDAVAGADGKQPVRVFLRAIARERTRLRLKAAEKKKTN